MLLANAKYKKAQELIFAIEEDIESLIKKAESLQKSHKIKNDIVSSLSEVIDGKKESLKFIKQSMPQEVMPDLFSVVDTDPIITEEISLKQIFNDNEQYIDKHNIEKEVIVNPEDNLVNNESYPFKEEDFNNTLLIEEEQHIDEINVDDYNPKEIIVQVYYKNGGVESLSIKSIEMLNSMFIKRVNKYSNLNNIKNEQRIGKNIPAKKNKIKDLLNKILSIIKIRKRKK